MKSLSRVRLFATPWTVAYQAPPSMGFSRQECWSGLPFSSPGDLSNPGIEPGSPTLRADALPSEPPGKPKTQKGTRNSSLLGAHGGPFMFNKFKLDFILHEHCKGATIMSANLINMWCQVLHS